MTFSSPCISVCPPWFTILQSGQQKGCDPAHKDVAGAFLATAWGLTEGCGQGQSLETTGTIPTSVRTHSLPSDPAENHKIAGYPYGIEPNRADISAGVPIGRQVLRKLGHCSRGFPRYASS